MHVPMDTTGCIRDPFSHPLIHPTTTRFPRPPLIHPLQCTAVLPKLKAGITDRQVQELGTGAIEDASKLYPAAVGAHGVVDALYVEPVPFTPNVTSTH